MNGNKLSVCIITLNEEKNLTGCLESVRGLADDLVVVDSGSSDRTVDIAKSFGAKVFYRKFDNYSNQKNFATEKATGEWILSLDADEKIEPKLSEEIKKAINSSNYNAYTIPRKNIILGKFIKYTRWQPELDRHIWLWRKDQGKWYGDVHEEVKTKGNVGKLINAKVHNQYETVSDFMKMMNSYSEIDSGERVKNGTHFSIFRLLYDPKYNFLVRYIYRLGILDGWRGFVLSYLMAVYHLELWVKIWEKDGRNVAGS